MDIVACCLGSKDEVISNVLLDEAIAVMAADYRIGQVHIFDFGLQLASIMLADSAAKDDGDLVRLSDGSVGVKQSLAEVIQRRPATEDEVVAKLDLREEQPMLTACFRSLLCRERTALAAPAIFGRRSIAHGNRANPQAAGGAQAPSIA